MEQPMIRTSQAPDNRSVLLPADADLWTRLHAALSVFLQGGATVVKDAPRLSRGYRQYRPAGTQAFAPFTQSDFAGTQPAIPTGVYIVTFVPEVQAIRYTTDGSPPSSTVGMLVAAGQYIDIALQDVGSLQFCAAVAGAIINMELFQVAA